VAIKEYASNLEEHKIGYPINENGPPEETKILPTKFVIKRMFLTDENKIEVFDKWKAHLVLRGDLQKETVNDFNLFSAIPPFFSHKTQTLAIDGPNNECQILRSGVRFSGTQAARIFHRH